MISGQQIVDIGRTADLALSQLAGWVVDASPSGDRDADFLARSTGPDIVRVWGFNDVSELNSGINGNVLLGSSDIGNPPVRYPTLDPVIKCSGNSSLHMQTPSMSASNASGYWSGNFSDDLSVRFGANSQVFEQVRFRINDVLAETVFLKDAAHGGGIQGGMKVFDMFAGNMVGGPRPDGFGISKFYSSSEIKVVVQGYLQHMNPIIYRYFNGATSNLMSHTPTGDILLQNALPTCLYTGGQGIPPKANVPGCWSMVKDNWMTFELGIELGANGTVTVGGNVIPVWLGSRVRLWAAHDLMPPQLLIDWKPGVTDYQPLWRGPAGDDQQFGQTVLFDYMTDKDATQVHGLGEAWYDELIVAKKPISFPGGYSIGP